MRCNGSNWAVYSPGSWDGFRNDLWALWAGVIMRLEHHLVGGYVRYISPHIIIIIIIISKYIYRWKWVDRLWLVKALSGNVEVGQNDCQNQSKLPLCVQLVHQSKTVSWLDVDHCTCSSSSTCYSRRAKVKFVKFFPAWNFRLRK